MSYNVNDIADWFLGSLDTDAGDTISPLKLQKLIYYAQAWYLTIYDEPLFDEKIEAWVHGPTVACVYERFKGTSRNADISMEPLMLDVELSEEAEELLGQIQASYGEHSARYLEKLTQSEIPWKKARKGLEIYQRSEKEITHQSMIDYYKKVNNGRKKI